MSGRLLRKVMKDKDDLFESGPNPKLETGSESESESPSPAAPSKNPFDLLEENYDNDNDQEDLLSGDNTAKVVPHEHPVVKGTSSSSVAPSRKSKKKKKKNKDKSTPVERRDDKSIDSILADLSINTNASSIMSQNSVVQPTTKKQSKSSVLLVDPKHLNVENELRKIFGSKVVNSFENNRSTGSSRQMRAIRRVTHNPRKTILVSASNHWHRWDGSLSMELLEIKVGIQYFRYVHTAPYHLAQQAFEAAKAINDINAIASILHHHPYHIESLLTFAELFSYSGEHQQSADAISKCLYTLECAWHPQFNPLQGNCQLKFTHDTNKPLFTALFSHMKNMDRRGCHRSALEVCKLLLSLDSDDPKGALFCIDYFAIRAQEYKWLEKFAEEYECDTSLWLFPNFSYSLAVSRFYIESEKELEIEGATSVDVMKQALMLHPLVLQKLVEKAPLKDSAWNEILSNPFFGLAEAGGPTLEHLISMYVERNYLIWRYPELQNLLKEAALKVIDSIKQNKGESKDWACVRNEAFSSEINEYSHLMTSDFSDTRPSLPPEELHQLMMGQHMLGAHGDGIEILVEMPRGHNL